MNTKVLRDIVKPQWFDIINLLKRSTGMSVAELAKELKMSYMGVKQHCNELHKRGYVDTWRRSKSLGRPEKAYRLTPKLNPIFPEVGSGLTLDILDAINENYGGSAAEKMLFTYFQKLGQRYLDKVKGGGVVERASSLARIREGEGYMSTFEYHAERGLQIVEYHSPLLAIAQEYPSVFRMEEQMFERILKCRIHREEEHASALVCYTFVIATD